MIKNENYFYLLDFHSFELPFCDINMSNPKVTPVTLLTGDNEKIELI